MVVTCETCQQSYDDTYRWTYCPHEAFEMHCMAVQADGTEKCCHTVESLQEWIYGTRP